MKIYVTKYALTRGILEKEAENIVHCLARVDTT